MSRKIMLICFCALASLLCLNSVAVADLVLSEGGPTGQWYNAARDGEGFFIEIIDSTIFGGKRNSTMFFYL